MADKNIFYNQVRYFERDFDVYSFDFRGFGQNKDMPYPYSLSDYVKEVEEYFYKEGIVSPNVIAHSFGGRVALKMAYQEKRAFSKIVLTGCAGLKPKKTIKKRIKTFAFNLLKRVVSKEKLLGFYSKDYLALNGVMKESFIKIVNEHLDYTLPFIDTPTLIINGSRDRETPPYMAKRLNEGIKNSRLIIIKGAGHFSFLDNPNHFNGRVKEFLSR